MFNGSFSRNMHSDSTREAAHSPVPGSESVYVRDMDDVKDATHGGFRSPKLDSRADRGSLPWAGAAMVTAVVVGLGVLALLGWASNQRLNRTEVTETVLHHVTCRSVGDQVAFSATYDRPAGLAVDALADAEGLEVEVMLLDNMGVLVEKKTDLIVFYPDGSSGPGLTASITFDHDIAFPRCATNVWVL